MMYEGREGGQCVITDKTKTLICNVGQSKNENRNMERCHITSHHITSYQSEQQILKSSIMHKRERRLIAPHHIVSYQN